MFATDKSYKILAVHGYEVTIVDGVPVFSPAAVAVCEFVIQIHGRYTQIFMLGGWDSPLLPPDKTIGMMMKDFLISRGVPDEKIVLPEQFIQLQKYMPPRDSAEEAVLLSYFCFHYEYAKNVHSIVALPWVGRLRHIYQSLSLPPPVYAVWVRVSMMFQLTLLIAQILASFDSMGYENCLPVGRSFRKNRLARSFLQPRSYPFEPEQRWLIP